MSNQLINHRLLAMINAENGPWGLAWEPALYSGADLGGGCRGFWDRPLLKMSRSPHRPIPIFLWMKQKQINLHISCNVNNYVDKGNHNRSLSKPSSNHWFPKSVIFKLFTLILWAQMIQNPTIKLITKGGLPFSHLKKKIFLSFIYGILARGFIKLPF